MSSHRTYNVVLRTNNPDGAPTTLKVEADDVDLVTDGEHDQNAWFNFYKGDGDNEVTIAAIPFKEVIYINAP